jgi:outer membrane protein OmpA-like peptidoglycan-associated protein
MFAKFMHFFGLRFRIAVCLLALPLSCAGTASAQEGLGPFLPHEGGAITTAWTNAYGPDAESWIRFTNVHPDVFDINYSSSRGTKAVRRIRVEDRMTARTMVLGYSVKMPLIMENTTTLGTSGAVLDEMKGGGQANSNLIYNVGMASMPGSFTLVDKGKAMSIEVGGHLLEVPVIHATGSFQQGQKKASGEFYFLDNRNNPLLLQYTIQFTGEKSPRTERIVRVDVGELERGKLEQTLAARKAYTTYGIHFDFDKATIQGDSASLLQEIAIALSSNPQWTLQITGYTDSIGKEAYNMKLSQKRADSIKAILVKQGVAAERLTTSGAGPRDPLATNKTLQGRALNRRVVLARTDR